MIVNLNTGYRAYDWLERQFLKITFDEEVSCDIQEIRQLIDKDSSASSSSGITLDDAELSRIELDLEGIRRLYESD